MNKEPDIEEILSPIPRKHDYEVSESTDTDSYHYEKETEQTAYNEAKSTIKHADFSP